MRIRNDWKGLASFVQRAQTTSTYAHLPRVAVVAADEELALRADVVEALDLDAHPLDVGLELALGCPVRVADVVSKLRTLTTHIALCHCLSPLCVLSGAYNTTREGFVQQSCTGQQVDPWPILARLSPIKGLQETEES